MDYLARQMPDASTLRSGRQIFLLYLLDYIVIIALFGAISALNFIKPFNQHFALQNYTLQYPYAVHERVPVTLLYICAVIAPAGIIAVWTLAIDPLLEIRRAKRAGRDRDSYKKGFWELNCGILGLLLSNTVAYVITGVLKNAIGKPRPDLIDRCQPDVPQDRFVSPVYGLSNSTICTQTDQSILHDGFRSFPSGHSSSSFAGLFFLSLFLAGKLHFLDHQGSVWKVFVVLVPTLGAALIAGSRIMDARHHPFDVITGSMLGILCAYIAYRQYFPSITSIDRMGRAYTVRRHHGPTGPEPVRSVHRANPSFTFEPADTSLDHDDDHAKQYSSPAYGAVLANPGGVQRSRSQALAAEPLRQRGISNSSNSHMSLDAGRWPAGNNVSDSSNNYGTGAAGLARTYSPDPSFVSQLSGGGGDATNSLFGRPSAEGPLGSEHYRTSAAWQGQQQQRQHSDIEALRASSSGAIVGGGHPVATPPIDGPTSPVEMNPLPSPKGTGILQQKEQQLQYHEHSVASEGREQGDGRYSFDDGNEHLIHPAFRKNAL